jgi:hypothetical protein
MLYKNYCNWQLVTVLSGNGLRRQFVSSFRFGPKKRRRRHPERRVKMPSINACFWRQVDDVSTLVNGGGFGGESVHFCPFKIWIS